MIDELKPCPHCGSSDFLTNGNPHPKRLACGNDACQMMGIWIDYDTWQSRPLEDALRTRAEAAEKKVKELEAASRWIPVSEGYPVENDTQFDVSVSYVGQEPFVRVASWQDGCFFIENGEYWDDLDHKYITHYRSRPQPPKQEGAK